MSLDIWTPVSGGVYEKCLDRLRGSVKTQMPNHEVNVLHYEVEDYKQKASAAAYSNEDWWMHGDYAKAVITQGATVDLPRLVLDADGFVDAPFEWIPPSGVLMACVQTDSFTLLIILKS